MQVLSPFLNFTGLLLQSLFLAVRASFFVGTFCTVPGFLFKVPVRNFKLVRWYVQFRSDKLQF
jgi:hypothetical protein